MEDIHYKRAEMIIQSLRVDLGLHHKTPALPTLEKWVLASWSEGYRAGYWARNECDELNKDQYPVELQ